MTDILRSPKLQPWHLDRAAVVYVHQPTPQQVLDDRESTARQYALADRAVALGWGRDRVATIDDDLGKCGQSIEGRPGFERLLAEVAFDRVGLILGLEMSRLARSCKDWHQLLELCGRFRVLLADADAVFDPTDHSDRLLLGLHGMMSEAELHVLKQRTDQGKLNKARRGELFAIPPIGYVRADPRRVGDQPGRAGADRRPADLRPVRPGGHAARPPPVPGPHPGPHLGPRPGWPGPGSAGVAAAEPGDVADPTAAPELRRGIPIRSSSDRPAKEAAGAAGLGQADAT